MEGKPFVRIQISDYVIVMMTNQMSKALELTIRVRELALCGESSVWVYAVVDGVAFLPGRGEFSGAKKENKEKSKRTSKATEEEKEKRKINFRLNENWDVESWRVGYISCVSFLLVVFFFR